MKTVGIIWECKETDKEVTELFDETEAWRLTALNRSIDLNTLTVTMDTYLCSQCGETWDTNDLGGLVPDHHVRHGRIDHCWLPSHGSETTPDNCPACQGDDVKWNFHLLNGIPMF